MRSTLYKRLLGFYGISLAIMTGLRLVFIGIHYSAGLRFVEIIKALGIGILIDSSVMSCCIVACFLLSFLIALLAEKVGKKVLTVSLLERA